MRDPSLRDRGLKLGALMRGYADSRDIARYAAQADMLRRDFRDFRERHRAEQIQLVASHAKDPEDLSLLLDSSRWLQRSAYHLWRIADLLRGIEGAAPHPQGEEQALREDTD